MYKVIGIKEILENILRLTKSRLLGTPNKSSLRIAYLDFLREAQPNVSKPNDIDLSFKWRKEDVSPLLEIFQEDSVLDDFEEIFDRNLEHPSTLTISRVQEVIKQMREISPEFASVIDLVIHTIFSFPSQLAGGGSTSAAIGCIWVDIRPHWQEQDILEFLVHETTHNLVFIDELCYSHYTNYSDIAKKENYANSAILNKPRPIDKVFHSIIVSTEVLLFRNDYLDHPEKPCLHPPSIILLKQTLESLDSIFLVEKLLTKRAKLLLEKCKEKLKEIETGLLCGEAK